MQGSNKTIAESKSWLKGYLANSTNRFISIFPDSFLPQPTVQGYNFSRRYSMSPNDLQNKNGKLWGVHVISGIHEFTNLHIGSWIGSSILKKYVCFVVSATKY